MAFLIASQETATVTIDALTTIIDWVDVSSYEDLQIIVENTGGGSADPVTDVQSDESTDGFTASALDQAPGVPAVPIAAATSSVQTSYAAGAWGTTYIRIRALCGAGNDTTVKAWLLADTLTVTLDTFALTTLDAVKRQLGITVTTSDALLTQIINAASAGIETYCGRKFKNRAYTQEAYVGDRTREVMVDNWPIVSVERVAIGRVGALQVKCTSTDAFSATASIVRSGGGLPANTGLKLSIHGGALGGDNTISFATDTTLTAVAAASPAGWSISVISDFGKWASTELIPVGSREALLSQIVMDVPDDRLCDWQLDEPEGIIYFSGGFPKGFNNIYVDYNGGFETIPADLEQIAISIVGDIFNSRDINKNLKSEKIGDYSYTLGGGTSGMDMASVVANYSGSLDFYKRIQYA